jgi:hypothetical protein
MARRLEEAGRSRYMAVINAGLSGNQLTSSDNQNFSQLGGVRIPDFMLGEAGLVRYEWDLAS